MRPSLFVTFVLCFFGVIIFDNCESRFGPHTSIRRPTVSTTVRADKHYNTGEDDEKTTKILIRNYTSVLYYDTGNSIDFSCYSDRNNMKLNQRLQWLQKWTSNGRVSPISDESVTKEVHLHLDAVFADNDTSLFCVLVNVGTRYSIIATSDRIRLILKEPNLTISVKPKKQMYQVNDTVTFTCEDHNMSPYDLLLWRGKTVKNDVTLKSNQLFLDNTLKLNVNESHHEMHVSCEVHSPTRPTVVSNVFTIIVDDITRPKDDTVTSVTPDNSTTPGSLPKNEPIDKAGTSVKPGDITTSGLVTKNEPTDDTVTSVIPDSSTTPESLSKNEKKDSSLLWIGLGVALLIVLLIIIAIVSYKIQKKRNVTPKVNDNPDTDQAPVYSYATAPVVSWEEAHARAANNRPLPRYQTVVPSLPPRNADQNEYDYIDPINLRRRNPPE